MTVNKELTTDDAVWSDRPSTAIAMAVADGLGREPTGGPVLDDYIDTDALDELFTGETSRLGGPIHVSFAFDGVEVTVDSEGGIAVQSPSSKTR